MSSGSTQPFVASGTATIAASTVSASASLPAGDTVLVFNSSAGVAFIVFGNGAVTATASGIPIPPGGSRLLYAGVANTVAAILSAGSGAVYVSAGTGTAY